MNFCPKNTQSLKKHFIRKKRYLKLCFLEFGFRMNWFKNNDFYNGCLAEKNQPCLSVKSIIRKWPLQFLNPENRPLR
jgi:hypothetical protein